MATPTCECGLDPGSEFHEDWHSSCVSLWDGKTQMILELHRLIELLTKPHDPNEIGMAYIRGVAIQEISVMWGTISSMIKTFSDPVEWKRQGEDFEKAIDVAKEIKEKIKTMPPQEIARTLADLIGRKKDSDG